jgi:hypothetical protein
MELPQMTGFSIALLPGAVLVIELTPQFARELAVGLFEAVPAMDRPPMASQLN